MASKKRLIDANALNDAIEVTDWYHISPKGYLQKGANSQIHTPLFKADDIFQALKDAPTVDAVEVVRCEKCLFRSQYSDENGCYKCGGLQTEDGDLVMMVNPDFYCAYGERKGNA